MDIAAAEIVLSNARSGNRHKGQPTAFCENAREEKKVMTPIKKVARGSPWNEAGAVQVVT